MEDHIRKRNQQRKRRALRVRKAVRGSASKPRLSVFRSGKHLSAQLIDDENHVTLFGLSTMSKELKLRRSKDAAKEIGKRIAEHAKKSNIDRAVFDRGHYKYHGIIAELADAARKAGLQV